MHVVSFEPKVRTLREALDDPTFVNRLLSRLSVGCANMLDSMIRMGVHAEFVAWAQEPRRLLDHSRPGVTDVTDKSYGLYHVNSYSGPDGESIAERLAARGLPSGKAPTLDDVTAICCWLADVESLADPKGISSQKSIKVAAPVEADAIEEIVDCGDGCGFGTDWAFALPDSVVVVDTDTDTYEYFLNRDHLANRYPALQALADEIYEDGRAIILGKHGLLSPSVLIAWYPRLWISAADTRFQNRPEVQAKRLSAHLENRSDDREESNETLA